jgi:hypothetical protein
MSEATTIPRATEPPARPTDSLSMLKVLAEGSAVFAGVTFIGGWAYLASYYRTFGVNPLELNFPIPVVCTLALFVMYESVWPLLVLAALITAVAVAEPLQLKYARGLVIVAITVIFLTAASAGAFRGRQGANEDMHGGSALPRVAFASREALREQPSCVASKTWGSYDCKLLLHMNDTYYFFQPTPNGGTNNLVLYVLKDSELLGVRIQRGLEPAKVAQ